MFKLDQFIEAIQKSVLSAGDALNKKNLEILDYFFEDSGDIDDIKAKLKSAVDVSKDIAKGDLSKLSEEEIKKLFETISSVTEALHEGKSIPATEGSGKLRPKTVTLQYPQKTPHGPEIHDVHVPLITLVPMSMAQVSEVKLRTDLELFVEKDQLGVSFPTKCQKTKPSSKNDKSGADESEKCTATLEITVTPSGPSDGLLKVVEGYEKALRAQIPG
jgi:hypothetical protein